MVALQIQILGGLANSVGHGALLLGLGLLIICIGLWRARASRYRTGVFGDTEGFIFNDERRDETARFVFGDEDDRTTNDRERY